LLELLRPDSRADGGAPAEPLTQSLAANDQRALDPAQLRMSATGTKPALEVAASGPKQDILLTDLRSWLVLLAGVLFAIERLLAHRRETKTLVSTT
jgi:hypothetical protein